MKIFYLSSADSVLSFVFFLVLFALNLPFLNQLNNFRNVKTSRSHAIINNYQAIRIKIKRVVQTYISTDVSFLK